MQFKVPQFLDIEDKIFGPFTFSQFAYLAGGGGICFVLYKLLGLLFGIIPMLAIAGFSLALTFYRPNNKPFIDMLEAGFKYIISDKLYVWRRSMVKKVPTETKVQTGTGVVGGVKLGGSRLRDLAWSLDVLDLKKNTEKRTEIK